MPLWNIHRIRYRSKKMLLKTEYRATLEKNVTEHLAKSLLPLTSTEIVFRRFWRTSDKLSMVLFHMVQYTQKYSFSLLRPNAICSFRLRLWLFGEQEIQLNGALKKTRRQGQRGEFYFCSYLIRGIWPNCAECFFFFVVPGFCSAKFYTSADLLREPKTP